MKLFKKLSWIISIVLCCLFACPSCIIEQPIDIKPYVFSTNYTIEEHIERIKERTLEVFEAEILNEEYKDCKVDIVYSIRNNLPELFVVEVEFTHQKEYFRQGTLPQEYHYYSTEYVHMIGRIKEDEYYCVYDVPFGGYASNAFWAGRSPYSYKGYWDKKKYYGSVLYGVEADNEIRILAKGVGCYIYGGIEYHLHYTQETGFTDCPVGGILPKEDYQKYSVGSITLPYKDGVRNEGPHC